MPRWTAADIADQSGNLAVVTGANSGLGYHTAVQLACRGARVVLACRDADRGAAACERLRAAAPGASAELRLLDLADLDSVRSFADDALRDLPCIDLLVNNAGIMAVPQRRTTAQGFELQFGTNHLGHFALTGLLLPGLLAAPRARVVTVTSTAHRMGRIDTGDLQAERSYRPWQAYGQSKLANLLFAFELDRRARAARLPLASLAAHPGLAKTNLQWTGPRVGGTSLSARALAAATRLLAQSDARGALPTLYAATAPDAAGGGFYGPGGPGEQRGYPAAAKPAQQARDLDTARRLWNLSEHLTGVSYQLDAPTPDGPRRGETT